MISATGKQPGKYLVLIWRDPHWGTRGPNGWKLTPFEDLAMATAFSERAGWQWSHTLVAETLIGMQTGCGSDYTEVRARVGAAAMLAADVSMMGAAGEHKPTEPEAREAWEKFGREHGWLP